MDGRTEWLLSGSIVSWGQSFVDEFTYAIFLELGPKERLRRLTAREVERYGDRIGPDGDMHANHLAFLEWARAYDTAEHGVRCRPVHLQWMSKLNCQVLQLNSLRPVDELVLEIMRNAA